MSTDAWGVNQHELPSNALLIPARVAQEMDLYRPVPPSFDEEAALQDVAAERRQQVAAEMNHAVVGQLVMELPQAADRGIVLARDLAEAKLLQRAVLFQYNPYYLVGRRAADNPKHTEILLAAAYHDEGHQPEVRKKVVYTADLELRDEAVIALHKAEYSPEEVRALRDPAGSGVSVGANHPRSMRLAAPPIFVPRGLRRPALQRGIRETYASENDYIGQRGLFPDGISNGDMESYGVYDHLSELAVMFGKIDVLKKLVEWRYPSERQDAGAVANMRSLAADLRGRIAAAYRAFRSRPA